ncbi:hypothetical protein I7I50_12715 [Histoplasma capsulatum G186AR]|uniref:Uncharacterized protein n=1 Tax=Ajellomyces capsulatus TaxID=5037 RepID=A0A8H8CRN9_AJECA|nr:hypothetical protein I7I52_10981 [Histoplasma capsulatum]QSS70922.1 hypothetical protein I7I50_12715 [Histoplasma capsulatum G186AR]
MQVLKTVVVSALSRTEVKEKEKIIVVEKKKEKKIKKKSKKKNMRILKMLIEESLEKEKLTEKLIEKIVKMLMMTAVSVMPAAVINIPLMSIE